MQFFCIKSNMLRTLRQSFRKKKQPRVPDSSRPHQWQKDEEEVKASRCKFHVKVSFISK